MLKLNKDSSIEKLDAIHFNQSILNYAKKKYKSLRQESKKVTFALQYGGTEHTLVKNCGFSKEEALNILQNYKKLYSVSEQNKKYYIDKASKDGYTLGAFGLKIRTPLLKQVLLNNRVTPKEAESEARTMSNARFQSYCMLNSRAGIEFNSLVRKDKELRLKVRPCVQIHDAQSFLIKEEPNVVLWVNHNLVKCAQWQNDPIIAHPDVHLGGNLSIFYPDWAHELELPNDCSKEQLIQLCKSHKESL